MEYKRSCRGHDRSWTDGGNGGSDVILQRCTDVRHASRFLEEKEGFEWKLGLNEICQYHLLGSTKQRLARYPQVIVSVFEQHCTFSHCELFNFTKSLFRAAKCAKAMFRANVVVPLNQSSSHLN